MVDMSDTKHFKTVLVSNFVVRVSRLNSNRCGENTKGPVVTSHANNNRCALAKGMSLWINN
jgi:hypothetical protein